MLYYKKQKNERNGVTDFFWVFFYLLIILDFSHFLKNIKFSVSLCCE